MMTTARDLDLYLADFEAFERAESRGAPGWLRDLRRSAISRFAEVGFPGPKDEDWRYTPTASLARIPFRLAADAEGPRPDPRALEPFLFGRADWPRLVFVNGRHAPELSRPGPLPAGARLEPLSEVLSRPPETVQDRLGREARPDSTPFVALNAAFLREGAFLHLPGGAVLPDPVLILFLGAGGPGEPAVHPRVLVSAGPASRATIIEQYAGLGPGRYLTNAVTELALEEGAAIDHYKVQREGPGAFHVSSSEAAQGRASRFLSSVFSLGGAFARNGLRCVLGAEEASCALLGLYLAAGEEFVDHHTTIDHAKPRGTSFEIYKGVLDGRARAVFNGKVLVRRDAQKTDAKQTNKNLLLSDGATVNTKPQLEIFADDVKCTHGATVGRPDDQQIFYLKSRGLDEKAALRLLTYGFAAELINRIPIEALKAELDRILLKRVGGEGGPLGR